MSDLQPILLEPRLLPKPWGGTRLSAASAAGSAVGESWELHSGNRPAAAPLPLLLKYIDAAEDLSVQVHPDNALARQLEAPQAMGKSEMWVVLHAAPGAMLYSGFKPGVDAPAFEAALVSGRVTELLNAVPVAAGDAFDIPAGRVHAIGGGILLAEVQQDSDLTYRVWDYGRLVEGQPRELHLAQARQALRFDQPFAASDGRLRPELRSEAWGTRELLLQGPYFKVERLTLKAEASFQAQPTPSACMLLQGALTLNGSLELPALRTALIPAGLSATLRPNASAAVALWVTV